MSHGCHFDVNNWLKKSNFAAWHPTVHLSQFSLRLRECITKIYQQNAERDVTSFVSSIYFLLTTHVFQCVLRNVTTDFSTGRNLVMRWDSTGLWLCLFAPAFQQGLGKGEVELLSWGIAHTPRCHKLHFLTFHTLWYLRYQLLYWLQHPSKATVMYLSYYF